MFGNWFEEQLKSRENSENTQFADAIDSIASAVMGERLVNSLDKNEVASTAIEEILKYYHMKPKKSENTPKLKTPSEQLDYYMRPLGVMNRNVILEKGWYRDASGPMLGTLKESGDAVALIPGTFAGYRFLDFRSGKWTKVNRKTAELIDDEAVCFYRPLPEKKLHVSDLILFMVRQLSISDIVLYISMMAISTLLGLISPMMTKWLFGDVLKSGSLQILISLAVFMLCYSLCTACFSSFRTLIDARISTKQNIAVQAAVMNRMMTMPPSFFKQYSSGELAQRTGYVQSLCSTLFTTIAQVGLSSIFSLVYIGQIYSFAAELVVPSIIITLVTAVMSLISTLTQMKYTKMRMEMSSKTSGLTYATITGIQKIKLAGAEKRMFSRWASHYSKEAYIEYDPMLFFNLSGPINLAISLLGTLVLYSFALKSGIDAASYYAFTASYGMVSSAFMSLAGVATSFANIKPMLDMSRPFMETEPEIQDGKEMISSLRGTIELNHVSFKYDESMPNVINDLSLKISSGEYVAIVGQTGCGKSTLLRLLLGFEKPQKGSVLYDKKDITKLNLTSLRRKIGVVMQDGKLMHGDIYSNIIISAPQLTIDDAWEAAEIASIADDIRAMPMGMNTIIAEGQGGISGGQRQRLMIARAIAPKPRVLMFDEATSALDNVTQKKVTEAIDSLKCTRIVIAHRLSTIRHADRIIFLSEGKIAEEGTYEELIAKNGLFAELVERQRLDVDA